MSSEKKDKIIIAMAADLSSSSDSLTSTSSSSDVFNDNEIITNSSDEFEISSSNEEAEYDILFSLYQLLMHGKRRSKVQGFLDTVHLYSDAIFKEHFRLQRRTAYLQIGILNIIIVFEYYLHSVKIRVIHFYRHTAAK